MTKLSITSSLYFSLLTWPYLNEILESYSEAIRQNLTYRNQNSPQQLRRVLQSVSSISYFRRYFCTVTCISQDPTQPSKLFQWKLNFNNVTRFHFLPRVEAKIQDSDSWWGDLMRDMACMDCAISCNSVPQCHFRSHHPSSTDFSTPIHLEKTALFS